MKTSDFYYDLPEELIAQDPLEDRSSSRLMVLDRESGNISHHIFKDIIDYLNPEDCLVINDTKVIPARLYGVKEDTGAHIEILLLKRRENDVWETLVRPGKKAKPGTRLTFGDGRLKAEVIDVVEEGNRLIHFEYEGIFEEILDQLKCRCRHISPTSFRTKTVTRRSMPNMKAVPLHPQPDCILHRNFWRPLKPKASASPV